jgi:hypothetical protein
MQKSSVGDNQQERLEDINWLVGIIEGEGCFSLLKKQKYGKLKKAYWPRIQITNTNLIMIRECKRILSYLGIATYFYTQLPKSGKPYYRLEVGGLKRVKRFLDIFLRYFRCRKARLEILNEYILLRLSKHSHAPITEEEHTIANKLFELNNDKSLESSEARRETEIKGMVHTS